MLRHRSEQIQIAVRVLDALVCAAAFFLAYTLRANSWLSWLPGSQQGLGSLESMSWMLVASLVLHLMLYPYLGFYQSLRLKTVPDIVGMILKAALFEFFFLAAMVFVLQAKETSRYFFGLFIVLNSAILLVEKVGARVALASIRRRGYNYRHVWIVGTGENARRVIAVLRKNKHWGYLPKGVLRGRGDTQAVAEVDGVPVEGALSDLERLVRERTVDELYFAEDRIDGDLVAEELALSQKLGIPARFSLGLIAPDRSKVTFSQLDQLPVVTLYTTLMTPAEALLKRLMDIAIAVVGLMITAVLYPWISWRIRRESPGRVIFKQVRVGENGRRFKCYKFRTMSLDAEERRAELEALNQMDGPIFKVENDPRIFPFGQFLRRTSLDELPQFFNILRGDMSVVGTRPPTPDEVSRYATHYRRRLSIRPGLTGLWQVSGRNRVTRFEDILALDLKYIDEWSIWLDLRIIARTVWVTVFGRGAY